MSLFHQEAREILFSCTTLHSLCTILLNQSISCEHFDYSCVVNQSPTQDPLTCGDTATIAAMLTHISSTQSPSHVRVAKLSNKHVYNAPGCNRVGHHLVQGRLGVPRCVLYCCDQHKELPLLTNALISIARRLREMACASASPSTGMCVCCYGRNIAGTLQQIHYAPPQHIQISQA